jgi:hypothetical protein
MHSINAINGQDQKAPTATWCDLEMVIDDEDV